MMMFKSLRNGLVHNWFRLNRPTTLGVRVIAIDEHNRVCLVRHTYTPGWHLPGGGVERGETCLKAAIKEAREEAGLIIEPHDLKLQSIHANFANFPGDHVLIYHAARWTNEQTSTAHEIAEYGFYPVDALPKGTTAGTKRRIDEWRGQVASENW